MSTTSSEALLLLERAAALIRSGEPLTHLEVTWWLAAWRSKLIPYKRPKRKRRAPEVDLACADYRAGVRGEALYRRHVPRYETLPRFRRRVEAEKLRNTILKRLKRAAVEKNSATFA